MRSALTSERLDAAYDKALQTLLAERTPEGHWVGELSSSALSTATAVSTLALLSQRAPAEHAHEALIANGVAWLVGHQNADGGWGDTVKSFSNISTTMLCRAALHLTNFASRFAPALSRAENWLHSRHGNTPGELAEAVRARYGKDRTFAVPILTTCAIAGLVSWQEVPALPFELACLPQSWFRFLRLPVVSYALPALIAIGQAVYYHRPPWNPFTRVLRALSRKRSLRVLERIQPTNGGFLEATPLTSFVTLSLAASNLADHPVTRKGAAFLVQSVRPDGSWPIDTNLATWVTTLAVNALAAAGELSSLDKLPELRDWLLRQQFKERHPYTGAAPGGWGWTPLPGSVPDADDTPGAMVAIRCLMECPTACVIPAQGAVAALSGLYWLHDLQNRDGGWPTFCRGWGQLPFDRSGADLTAHVMRALRRWAEVYDRSDRPNLRLQSTQSIVKGLAYLAGSQRRDGSWLPLWFGNQHAPNEENPTYGTARVLAAYRDLDMMNTEPARRGVAWLRAAQNADGGWGGAADTPSSVEETALAVDTLLDAPGFEDGVTAPIRLAVNNGLGWLVEQVEAGTWTEPAPIGFYFAKLWYYERLYPIIFTVAALGRARRRTPTNYGTQRDS
jgi:squalene-hopene/tetraprenyl-beta-curcumene cyclase